MSKGKNEGISRTQLMGLLFVTAISVAGIVFLAISLSKPAPLPFPSPPEHAPGPFSFLNQNGELVTEKSVEGKVTVVEYFFTTCPGICKVMNKNLELVYTAFKKSRDVCILSHTVDPLHDSVNVLLEYSERLKVQAPVWQFLTGDKEKLYKAARIDYLLAVEDPPTEIENDFIHTEYVALLDKERRIRGFYNATDQKMIRKLIDDIRKLLEE